MVVQPLPFKQATPDDLGGFRLRGHHDRLADKKVIAIDQPAQPDSHKPRLVASDDSTRRLIFGIGRQRIAFDFTTRVTHLDPGTGDAPAPVVSVKNKGTNSG